MPPEPPHRLDTAMNARRIELRLNWREVAARADISYETLRAARRGDNQPGALTQAAIEQALAWKRGSVAAILDGGRPSPLGADEGRPEASGHPQAQAMIDLLATLPPEAQEEVLRRYQQGDTSPTPSPEHDSESPRKAG